jgi:leader peptidase (prepilin peptidase) / N-methyltransferase
MTETLTSPELPADAVESATPEARRRPTRELLPTGARRVVVALACGVAAVASLATFGATGWGFLGAVFCPVLVLLAAIDFEHHLLPNDILLPTALASAAIIAIADPGALLPHLAAGAALGIFLFVFALIFRGGLGMGDVKLGFVVGLALGISTLPAMLLSFLGLFLGAVWILARHGLAARKHALAFGPFIAFGSIVVFFLS